MTQQDMKQRTKRFALEVMKLVAMLPRTDVAQTLAKQLIRSGTSVGANYRAACRGRSTAEFIAKLGIVEEEADESDYWLELIEEGGLLPPDRVRPLRREVDELISIVVATKKTAAARKSQIANRKS